MCRTHIKKLASVLENVELVVIYELCASERDEFMILARRNKKVAGSKVAIHKPALHTICHHNSVQFIMHARKKTPFVDIQEITTCNIKVQNV